ncbi:MAG: Ldh family oxidoreductase [Gemmatimonadales bacterium]|jgi:LDH2 family malate/lactate/ureidoglycolate dehydrogenase|nr:Ldh family oxidoreductase [Gemmatimonadales bacterium]NCG33924.1 Ldh family oxidoreductase [Pseudomonadota bacterium]MBT3499987.1 Ldh family oxidoreductase [Gemmatimonadales bacterium]MBT3774827.1 Ldh family oxidoreductase [Gemmatimonadales bacterium]MBT3957946.1 Ldh family oxidoreductase [Gemmatimonadales bacterium]
MTAVTGESLGVFVVEVLRAMGLPEEEAEIFGGALLFSELRFHPGHGQGVKKLRRYGERFARGLVDPSAPWEPVKESPALALVDAHNGIGTVAAARGMRLAIEKAKVCGIGQVVVRNSTHFGSSAVHACLAADEGCIGIALTNAGPEMAPWGAREGAVGTNPWGIAAPTGLGFPAVLDIALTTAGKGMMTWNAQEGRSMPLDWALTPEGEETDDPSAAMAGALLGIGRYKGYGLAFMTDVLTGVIAGGGYGLTPYSVEGKMDVSHTLIALDIDWFMPLEEFRKRMDDFASMVKSRALRPGFDEILIPGEQEARRVARKSAAGVPLENGALDDLRVLGAELGVAAEIVVVGPWEDATL